ncbi:unnamed protein product [Chrysoparadoxa australica]
MRRNALRRCSSIFGRRQLATTAHLEPDGAGSQARSRFAMAGRVASSGQISSRNVKELTAADVLKQKQLLRQQLEVRGNCSIDEAITLMVNQEVTSVVVINRKQEVIGMFTARDLLRELARWPRKEDALKVKAHEFMIPLEQLVYCSPSDSLHQCLLVMAELDIRNLPVLLEDRKIVAGILNLRDISDITFTREDVGGKKSFLGNISSRRGLPQGVGLDLPEIQRKEDYISASIGVFALPHPFKTHDQGVSASPRDHRHLELAVDPSLSEDAHLLMSLKWPNKFSDTIHYVGVADGVGSWRSVGVDPRNFSRSLMRWAESYILSMAPRPGENELVMPPKPHQVLSAAWEMTLAEGVVGSSTACVATLDYELDQLTFSNIGDNGVVVLRHIDSDVAGYMRNKQTPRHMRTSDLRIAFISQQQLRSFNLPFQFGYTNVTDGNNFETPHDTVNTAFPVLPGDIIIIATDGLFDNVELDEICNMALEWEVKWFGGPLRKLRKHNNAALTDLAETLAMRARDLSLDTSRDSPFALLAKENDCLWSGGIPDDITVAALRVVSKTLPAPEGEEEESKAQ